MSGRLRICRGDGGISPTQPSPLQPSGSGDGSGGDNICGSTSVTENPVIHLTSALLDPTVPDALRYTHSMEVNSISLQAIAMVPDLPPSETRMSQYGSEDVNKGSVLGELDTMTSRTEWRLIVHPPLVFVNTLPFPLEIELTQSCMEAPQLLPPSGGGGVARSTRQQHNNGDGSHAMRTSGRREGVISHEGAKDLFFLPDIVQATSDQPAVSFESVASRREVKVAAANALASDGGNSGDCHTFHDHNGDLIPLKLRSVWNGVVGVGKKVKVGSLARNQFVFLRVRLFHGSDGGVQGLGRSWSDPEVLYPVERDNREAFNSEPPHCITWSRAAADYGMNESMTEMEEELKKGITKTKTKDSFEDEIFMAGAQWGGSKCLRVPRVSSVTDTPLQECCVVYS